MVQVLQILSALLLSANALAANSPLASEAPLPRSAVDQRESAPDSKKLAKIRETREIAKELVQRQAKKDLKREVFDVYPTFDFLNKTQLILAFPFQYFTSIQKQGFLNQFQVDHSKYMDRKHRRIVEDRIFKSKIAFSQDPQAVANYLRPKYTYLALDIERNDPRYEELSGMFGMKINGLYGNVFAKFKDEVKQRSTMTPGDSLYLLGSESGEAQTLYATQTSPPRAYYYYEAQVWGELTLEDVDYILVNCGFGEKSLSAEEIEVIKSSGVDVFKCQPRRRFGHAGDAHFLDRGPRL